MNKSWQISCFGWDNLKGVYCVCSIVNGETKIHYIGSSKNIGKRVTNPNHPYRLLFNAGINVFIKYKETDDYLALEVKMIGRLNPPINKNHKTFYYG